MGGNATSAALPGGLTVSGNYQSATNFTAPSSITANTLSNTLQWSTFLGLTQNTGPNGDSAGAVYDSYARPASSTSATGAVTTYTYATSAPWGTTATVNGRWSRTMLDGFGRTVMAGTGNGSTTVSMAETVYASCACSPIGKVKQQAMPHAPGGAVNWITYNYDALGRTVSLVQPDGSTKTYFYLANTVRVTDEAGKWKTYAMDALGNLTQVLEPDPEHVNYTYTTTYGYDLLNHLVNVSMPRPTGTQTRTFNYGNPPGAYLLSATNPENGTVRYTYGPGGLLATRTDAKNQQIRYTYDGYLRLTRKSYYLTPTSAEDTAARVDIGYDAGLSSYSLGRVSSRQYAINGYTFSETYQYSPAGQVASKALLVLKNGQSQQLVGSWTYDNEGRVATVTYPTAYATSAFNNLLGGQVYTYGYDVMGRLASC